MKKFLAIAIFALGIFILQMPQAAAQVEYVGDWEGGWRAYLMTETIRPEKSGRNFIIYCRLKAISPKSITIQKHFDYAFTFHNDTGGVPQVSFRDSTGATGNFVIGSPGVYQVEHNTAVRLLEIMQEIMNARR